MSTTIATEATQSPVDSDEKLKRAQLSIEWRLTCAGALAIMSKGKLTLDLTKQAQFRHEARNLMQEAIAITWEHPLLAPDTRARVRKLQEVMSRG